MTEVTLGQVIWSAVKPIIKIYLIIGTGYFLAKRNILTVETTRNVSDIILTILLPCLVFNKVVTNIEDSDIKDVGIVCLSAVLIFGTGALCGIITKLTSPIPKKWFGGLMAGAIFPNISDIPIAYLQTLDSGLVFTKEQGEKGIAHTCIFLTMFTLCLFNLGGFRLMEYDFRDVINPKIDEENQINGGLKRDEDLDETAVNTSSEQVIEDTEVEEEDDETTSDSESLDPRLTSLNPIALTSENKRSNSIDQQQLKTLKQRLPSTTSNTSARPRRSSRAISIRSKNSLGRSITNNSATSSMHSHLRPTTTELRQMPSQTVDDIVEEYSEYPKIQDESEARPLSKILTTDVGITSKDIQTSVPDFLRKYHLGIVIFFIKNCLRPCSISIIISLIIAFIPWVKALFVSTTVSMPNAPDALPPLNFIMDYTSYVGAASVPFALILLGGSIGRLSLGNLQPGFWKGALLLVILRLCVMPILGVLWVSRLVSAGWIKDDDYMLMFVIMISWGLPSMTTQIYFTAFYTPLDAEERVQMDCASLYLLLQYPILVISLPFLVTYIVKVQFGM